MNIAPTLFSPVKFNYNPVFKKPVSFKGTKIEGDSFSRQQQVEQEEVSTSEVGEINPVYKRAFEKFQKEAEEYIMNSPKVTFEGLSELVSRYSIETKVEEFNETKAINTKTAAVYDANIFFEISDDKIVQSDCAGTIYVAIPKKLDKNSRAELLSSFIHEGVHMFQEETAYTFSGGTYISKFFKDCKSEDISEKIKAIEKFNSAFPMIEQNIFTMVHNFLISAESVDDVSLDNFEKYMQSNHGIDSYIFLGLIYYSAFDKDGASIKKALGKNTILNYTKYKIKNEIEAYKKEDEILMKYCDDVFTVLNSALIIDLYTKFYYLLDVLEKKNN